MFPMTWYRVISPGFYFSPLLSLFKSGKVKDILILYINRNGFIDTYLYLYSNEYKKLLEKSNYILKEELPTEEINEESHYYIAVAKHDDFYLNELSIPDTYSLLESLPPHSGVAIYCCPYPYFEQELEYKCKQAIASNSYEWTVLRSKLREISPKDKFYIISIILFTNNKDNLNQLRLTAGSLTRYSTPKWEFHEYKSWSKVLKRIESIPRFTVPISFLKSKKLIAKYLVKRPKPSEHLIARANIDELKKFLISPSPIYYYQSNQPLRKNSTPYKKGFKIGVLEVGCDAIIDTFVDLRKNIQVLGGSYSTRLSFLKLFVHRLNQYDPDIPIIVIDPEGRLSEELSRIFPRLHYYHLSKAPFGVNILEDPLDTSILAEILTDTLIQSKENKNVKTILETALNLAYTKLKRPTVKLVYKILDDIKSKSYPPYMDEDTRKYIEKLEYLYNKHQTSFTLVLKGLKKIIDNPDLYEMIKMTTITFSDTIKNGRITLFSIPAKDLGEDIASLLSSIILMKLFKLVNNSGKSVVVVCNEFQMFKGEQLIKTVLKQAKLSGLYIVLSHQNMNQIDQRWADSVIKNAEFKIAFKPIDVNDLSNIYIKQYESLIKEYSWINIKIFGDLLDTTFYNELRRRLELTISALPSNSAIIYTPLFEEIVPPFLVHIDEPDAEPVFENEAIRTFEPSKIDPTEDQYKIIFNPIFGTIDPPQPLKQLILFELMYKGEMTLEEIKILTRSDDKTLQKVLSELHKEGYISYINDNTIELGYKDFLEDYEPVYTLNISSIIIRSILWYYYSKLNCYVTPIKKKLHDYYPEMVAIPYKVGSKLDYRKIIAIKIIPEEDKEQIELLIDDNCFTDVHIWTYNPEKLHELIGENEKVKIYSLNDIEITFKQLVFLQPSIASKIRKVAKNNILQRNFPKPEYPLHTSEQTVQEMKRKLKKMIIKQSKDSKPKPSVQETVKDKTVKKQPTIAISKELPKPKPDSQKDSKLEQPAKDIHKKEEIPIIEIVNIEEKLIRVKDLILLTKPTLKPEELIERINHAKKVGIKKISIRKNPRRGDNVYILLNDGTSITCKFVKKINNINKPTKT
jgi:hypothetical protein